MIYDINAIMASMSNVNKAKQNTALIPSFQSQNRLT